ncbi:MAG TPA: FAD-dependent oxidoreductase [Candidatus Polarisedimenticolaceae bacterium]|nr:FAD-dependent oxidoreductase [Candidatus Polarisedimenticolaceae bacterium]
MNPVARYTRWLHTGFPAGTVEPLPEIGDDGSTAVPGLYVAGDLRGIPLLKFAADSGARVVRTIAGDPRFRGRERDPAVVDLLIVGGGVSGMAAALEAKRAGIDAVVLESSEPFATVVNFPKGKPIFVYPTAMKPAGTLQVTAKVKEPLVQELERQIDDAGIAVRIGKAERVERQEGRLVTTTEAGESIVAHRVLLAIGRAGAHRRLGVPGEARDRVYDRLHDPADFTGQNVLVVGGGDAAVETALALDGAGARVTLAHRGTDLARPKPESLEALAASTVDLRLETEVEAIEERAVVLRGETIENDAVFAMIGRLPATDLLRRSGVAIRGDRPLAWWLSLAAILAAAAFVYNWKAGGALHALFERKGWFPAGLPGAFGSPGFWYSLAYTLCVVAFGFRRMAKRRTPYVKRQTLTLMAIQIVPLFLLPYFILPWMGHHGWFDGGLGKTIADQLFPETTWDPSGREYWRAFGFLLAWPLFIWNVFSAKPLALWLAISFVQTFVLIPWMVHRWGKGAYCGWICSCGALAETLGDAHRGKMPHGPRWNLLNMTGQVVLAAAFVLALLRIVSWIVPGSLTARAFDVSVHGYMWTVDVGLAGILGVGLYFHLSGRTWCRFACPLAALMHVYARFSSFRILADKKKCISCNVCTSVCHQGIDVMSFAQRGRPMNDPQCVRCSACVESCPTGVLQFGRVSATGALISVDSLWASPVVARERSAPTSSSRTPSSTS